MPQNATPEQLEFAFAAANKNLLAYSLLMYPPFEVNWHHRILARKLEAVARGDIKRLMVFMPPRSGKSVLCSQMFPSWFIGHNPTAQTICATYGHELAQKFGRDVRNLLNEQAYRFVFPDVRLAEDSQAKDKFNTDKGGVYMATGVGGGLTGWGADLLLIDDPHKDRQEANSEVMRNNVWDWYTSTAHTRLMPNGRIIIILTRWHEDDLAGRILANEGDKWDVVSFPALAEQDEQYRHRGEALWPQRYSVGDLNDIRQSIGAEEFSCLYQQNPVSEEAAEFKKAWFKYYRDDQLPGNLHIFTTVDPAISKKSSADDSCVMTVGVAPDNTKYILEYTAAKLNPSELIEEIFRHYDKFKPSMVGIETVAYQEALSHFMKVEMVKRNVFMNIEEYKTREDKETKIRGLIPHYKLGMMYHRAGMCEKLEEQLLRFPRAAHDDIVDALASQAQFWAAPKYERYKPVNHIKTLKQMLQEENKLSLMNVDY